MSLVLAGEPEYPLLKGKHISVQLTGNPSAMHKTLIGFKSQPDDTDEAIVRKAGGRIKYKYRLVHAIAASVPEAAIEGLLNSPKVAYIETDGLVRAVDSELDNSWGVKHIEAGRVHDMGNKGKGVKVAVIDSGIDYNHPDIKANYYGGYDFVNEPPRRRGGGVS